MLAGVEQYLAFLWQRWQIRGARPAAQRPPQGGGWLLTLCFRAKLTAWLIFLLFAGLLAEVLVMQAFAPQPRRVFLLEAIAFSVFSAMGGYYLLFAYWYRVLLDEQGLELRRFLLPTRRIPWQDIVEFSHTKGDELLKLRAQNGQTISLYLSVHGLSAIRRCLAVLTPTSNIIASWSASDPALMEDVPSWRCSDMDLEDDPFDPLGTSDAGSADPWP